jgi:hypothetical protein
MIDRAAYPQFAEHLGGYNPRFQLAKPPLSLAGTSTVVTVTSVHRHDRAMFREGAAYPPSAEHLRRHSQLQVCNRYTTPLLSSARLAPPIVVPSSDAPRTGTQSVHRAILAHPTHPSRGQSSPFQPSSLRSSPNRAFGLAHHLCGGQSLCGGFAVRQAGAQDSILSPSAWSVRLLGPCLDQALAGSPLSPAGLRESQQPTNHFLSEASQRVGCLRQAVRGHKESSARGQSRRDCTEEIGSRTDRQTVGAPRAPPPMRPVSLDPF